MAGGNTTKMMNTRTLSSTRNAGASARPTPHTKLATLAIFILILCTGYPATGKLTYVWIGGSNVTATTTAIGHTSNWPGARMHPASCIDPTNSNRFLMFGGGITSASANWADLWAFDMVDMAWTWLSGTNESNFAGNATLPRARRHSSMTPDPTQPSCVLLSGGSASGLYMTSIWRYCLPTKIWTLLSGSDTSNAPVIVNQTPGGRMLHSITADPTNSAAVLILFGWGVGTDGVTPSRYRGDAWRYFPGTNTFRWFWGTNQSNTAGATENSPNIGPRHSFFVTKDPTAPGTSILIFGGVAYTNLSGTSFGEVSDVWSWNIATNQMRLLSGAASLNIKIDGAGKGPGSRSGATPVTNWRTGVNSVLYVGGKGYTSESSDPANYLNDIYEYFPATNTWVYLDGSNVSLPNGKMAGMNDMFGGREQPVVFKHPSRNASFFVFGGRGVTTDETAIGTTNDMWYVTTACREGQFLDPTNLGGGCKNCPVNTYSEAPGSIGCKPCPSDSSTRGLTGQSYCQQAMALTYVHLGGSNLTGQTTTTNWPRGMFGSASCVDPTNANRLLIFGGNAGGAYNDMWALDMTTYLFSHLKGSNTSGAAASNDLPQGLYLAGMDKDPSQPGCVLIFGGGTTSVSTSSLFRYCVSTNTYQYISGDNSTSTNPSPGSHPGSRTGHIWMVDPTTLNSMLFGMGQITGEGRRNDIWRYIISGNTWSFIAGTNSTSASGNSVASGIPYTRFVFGYAPDPAQPNSRIIIFGGSGLSAHIYRDIWRLNIITGRWTLLSDTSTNGQTSGVSDGASPGGRGRLGFISGGTFGTPNTLVVVGGDGNSATSTTPGDLNDIWALNTEAGTWRYLGGSNSTDINGQSTSPEMFGGRRMFVTAPHPSGRGAIIYGGIGYTVSSTGSEGLLNDLWLVRESCPAGTYLNPYTSQCVTCPVNTYSSSAGAYLSCTSCPAGATTNGVTGATSSSSCGCPAGFYSSNPATTPCSQCAANTYRVSWGSGASSCTSCPYNANTNGLVGATSSSACGCPAGYFSTNAGSTSCSPCAANTYRSSWASGTSSCTSCPNNANTNGATGATSSSACGCPAGYFSTNAAVTPCSQCAVNTYRSSWAPGASTCTSCPNNANTNGVTGATSSAACGCPAGFFSSNSETTPCAQCAADTFRSSWVSGATSCTSCPSNASTNGATGTTSSSACGCPAGYFSANAATTACSQCAQNSYKSSWTSGTSSCTFCPPNASTNGASGATSSSACGCPAGYYSPNAGTIPCSQCAANTFRSSWASGASTCTSCPANATTDGAIGGSSSTACGCLPGFFSVNPGTTACTPCAINSYRAGWNSSLSLACSPCDSNTTTNGTTGASTCICKSGSYGSGLGSCQECPANTYKPLAGNGLQGDVCLACPGAFISNPGSTSSSDCAAGIQCPKGTFQSGQNCAVCPANTLKYTSGNTTSCATTCPGNTTTNGNTAADHDDPSDCSCPAGTYLSSDGNNWCLPCSTGKYSITWGPVGCQDCPAPTWPSLSEGATTCDSCAAGYILNGGDCTPCAADTYKSNNGPGSCSSCPSNATTGGQVGATSSSACGCESGHGSVDPATTSCTTCAIDTFRIGFNNSVPVTCITCPANATTNGASGMSHCGCPSGYFSPDPSSIACTPCAVDTFRSNWSSAPSSCLICPPGATTNNQTGQSVCGCPAGYYSEDATIYPCLPCPLNTFRTSWSNASNLSCTNCPLGTEQPALGQELCITLSTSTSAYETSSSLSSITSSLSSILTAATSETSTSSTMSAFVGAGTSKGTKYLGIDAFIFYLAAGGLALLAIVIPVTIFVLRRGRGNRKRNNSMVQGLTNTGLTTTGLTRTNMLVPSHSAMTQLGMPIHSQTSLYSSPLNPRVGHWTAEGASWRGAPGQTAFQSSRSGAMSMNFGNQTRLSGHTTTMRGGPTTALASSYTMGMPNRTTGPQTMTASHRFGATMTMFQQSNRWTEAAQQQDPQSRD